MSDGLEFRWNELDLLIPRPRPKAYTLTAEDILGPGGVSAPVVDRPRPPLKRDEVRVPPLVEARDPLVVEIDAFSLGAIERAVDAAGPNESAGWLFAHAKPQAGHVAVVHATASPVARDARLGPARPPLGRRARVLGHAPPGRASMRR